MRYVLAIISKLAILPCACAPSATSVQAPTDDKALNNSVEVIVKGTTEAKKATAAAKPTETPEPTRTATITNMPEPTATASEDFSVSVPKPCSTNNGVFDKKTREGFRVTTNQVRSNILTKWVEANIAGG
jgi:hypothetical protein